MARTRSMVTARPSTRLPRCRCLVPGRGATLGVLVAAARVDSAFAATLKRNTGAEVVFFTRDTDGLARGQCDHVGPAASILAPIGSDTADSGSKPKRPRATGSARRRASLGERNTARGHGRPAIAERSDGAVSGTGTCHPVEPASWESSSPCLGPRGWRAASRDRSRRWCMATRRVGEGDYSPTPAPESADEVGELAPAFQRMTHELREKQQLVDYLGGGRNLAPVPGTDAARVRRSIRLPRARCLRRATSSGRSWAAAGWAWSTRAFDRDLNEAVALKTLHPALQLSDPDLLERFKQEIRLARRITHRNVVRTHDLGESHGIHFITMEFVDGSGLDAILAQRGAPAPSRRSADCAPGASGPGGRARSRRGSSRHQAGQHPRAGKRCGEGDGLRHCAAGGTLGRPALADRGRRGDRVARIHGAGTAPWRAGRHCVSTSTPRDAYCSSASPAGGSRRRRASWGLSRGSRRSRGRT